MHAFGATLRLAALLSCAAACCQLSIPAAEAQALTLSFTNTILAEGIGELTNWGRVFLPAPSAIDRTVSLAVDDASELLVPTGITIKAFSLSEPFSITPLQDSERDGTISVLLTASSAGFADGTGILDVADTGGIVARLGFSADTQIDRFSLIASDTDLGGPVQDNYSGTVRLQDTGELMILLNRGPGFGQPPRIKIYDTNGVYQRTITMTDFDDAEGICRVTNDLYAISEEGNNDDITLVTITGSTTNIDKDSGQVLSVTFPFGDKLFNKGMEGVTYDELNDCFYVVQEAFPMGVYRVRSSTNGTITDVVFDAERVFLGLATDLSDLTYDPYSGHLFILSDESNRLFECTMAGQILQSIQLSANQAEGLTFFDDEQTLFIVGEPNQAFWYRRDAPSGSGLEGTNALIELCLSKPLTNNISLDFVAAGISATVLNDFSPATGTVVIAAGETTASISIDLISDGVTPEADETFLISITNVPPGLSIGPDFSYLYTILGTPYSMVVYSEHGTPLPPVGTNFYSHQALLSCTVPDSPLLLPGGTQLVCKGWIGAGSVPPVGDGADTGILSITNSSVITWLWMTNVWLGAAVNGGGVVDGGTQWLALSTNATLSAVTNAYHAFAGWSGDLSGADTNQLEISLVMDRSRQVAAYFPAFLATNEVPHWWLAQFYGHTDNFDVVALSDTDVDGFAAWEEFITYTDPTNADSFLWLSALAVQTGQLSLAWPGSCERLYAVYGSSSITNLSGAEMLTNGLPGLETPTTVFTRPVTSALPAFFWVEAAVP